MIKRKIKSITLTNDYDAVYNEDDEDGQPLRQRITGFAVVRCREADVAYEDIEPFVIEAAGVVWCSDLRGYEGVVRRSVATTWGRRVT